MSEENANADVEMKSEATKLPPEPQSTVSKSSLSQTNTTSTASTTKTAVASNSSSGTVTIKSTPTPSKTTSIIPNPSVSGISGTAEESISEVLEERLIDAEYKIWKKNTPYLYDVVMTHSLEWPSLTCEWLPYIRQPDGQPTEEHSLLLGTHTTGEQNYLMVASAILPKSEANVVVAEDPTTSNNSNNSTSNDTNNTASATKPTSTSQTGGEKTKESLISATPVAHYDDERNEVGGFGFSALPTSNSSTSNNSNPNQISTHTPGKIEIRMKVKHLGEVNRARYMPQNHFIVATRGPDPEIYIFDLSKHSSFPDDDTECAPQCVCVGHEKEGYGLAWSPHQEGLLVSASEDGMVLLWDVQPVLSGEVMDDVNQVKPKRTFVGHTNVVEDVAWHCKDENMIGSVGDDKSIILWDIRKGEPLHVVKDAHDGDINSIAFNPINEHLFVTGSADKTVALWDMRNLKAKMQSLIGHNDQVYQVSWAPFNEAILASCSADRRVNVWDLSRIGDEQTPEDAEDGPPELLFMHGGHTSKVSDFSWNNNDRWTIASVAEDNVLQVWNMAEEIYAGDDDYDEDDDGMLGEDDIES